MASIPSTVFVIDDDASVREALGSLIRSVGLLPHLNASVEEFLRTSKREGPACLVLDVRVPGVGGLDCQRRLTEAGVRIPIILLTGQSDTRMSVRVMKAGVADFLTKPFRDEDLLSAVQLALEQDSYRREEEQAVAELRERFDSLSPDEREVMSWVASGRLNKQIAVELNTSEISVKARRIDVMRKMEADSVIDLARMAVRLGLALKF